MSTVKRTLEGTEEDSTTKRTDYHGKGIAQLKPEYIVMTSANDDGDSRRSRHDDAMDEEPSSERLEGVSGNGKPGGKKNKKKRGQNKNRDNRQVKEHNVLCPRLIQGDVGNCTFGDKCRFNHDIEAYLAGKKVEIQSDYFKECPVYQSLGRCPMGYKCRFLSSHMDKDSRKLLSHEPTLEGVPLYDINKECNHITYDQKADLIKRRFQFVKSEEVLEIIDAMQQEHRDLTNDKSEPVVDTATEGDKDKAPQVVQREQELQAKRDKQKKLYLEYKDTRYFASEKRPLDFHHKKILSPLTTVGNLPYRRLMKKMGCDITYSEMALAVPLIQGQNSEWALAKCHTSERAGFGVQLACSKAWQAAKATEALVGNLLNNPNNADNGINEINLNAGCPIDLLYRQGAGSALLDNPARLIRVLNSMNYVSQEVPITVKIRAGTKDGHNTADALVKRLVYETDTAAITLHGRSRQQRYTKLADWEYIAKTAQSLRDNEVAFNESEQGKEARDSRQARIQFVGNGDINNYEDWYTHVNNDSNMDSVMVARGALIKPWLFEEIDAQQHLDKSSTERLSMLQDYARYSMEHWGTDEYGIAQCRRYFCDFMSFFHRYVPMGICERFPVKLNERPPNWIGRDEMETLLGSTNSNDWIKLSEMFFGPAEDHFIYTPKHKSNSY
ncbi:similar to Saccharomyces cerevisiae YLR401C DUS3 Dihydrouridine synthase, member of a widespread family of conserved proteins including Smm1p, Dus1p, and Dus4p [Maudiozyma barnettii]|uniref:tRNA-dihydrouridine(47) synthase [NAD(P)(+)] n=1 Tax=Maudiozyma barnettii TaxID=61262 RepID=A0A8H2ZJ47_9SACH|nr:tRNA dihydrouridine synthase DUS3 [Kazachstania barnettii]CAB4256172.1 similar to Saccharomyces cerevisiae YLR401C DUS3 Dihydrouridine synthase, member of a widespread family of conserved proteins including Smm1p, Dus1p, and Dus4p [Kazachstania barnettii]CAD1784780.1 similar to Saccharomyces cerevisiae YLR401C DUS3 Dihydrouridine synthase, member of a widespread family of conserved proteins including Smm1p, Dus1p, and Dus4p [Kazachstania barnettii]